MTGEHYFGISQPDKFAMPKNHTYGMMSVIVAKKGQDGLKFIGGKGKPERDNWFMVKCDPGQYVAFVSTMRDNNNTNDISFWVYGPKSVEISRVKNSENISKGPELLAQIMLDSVKFNFIDSDRQGTSTEEQMEAIQH